MAVTFNPATGIQPQNADEVRQAVAAAWQAAFQTGGSTAPLNT